MKFFGRKKKREPATQKEAVSHVSYEIPEPAGGELSLEQKLRTMYPTWSRQQIDDAVQQTLVSEPDESKATGSEMGVEIHLTLRGDQPIEIHIDRVASSDSVAQAPRFTVGPFGG